MKTLFPAALLFLQLVSSQRAADPAHGQPFKILPQGAAGQQLLWGSVAGSDYLVQTSVDFSRWTDVDLVTATGTTTSWVDPYPRPGAKNFYRITLPQPQVMAVQPMALSSTGATMVYFTGQCFTGAELFYLNGALTAGLVFDSPTQLHVALPALPAGLYELRITDASSVLVPGGRVTIESNPQGLRIELPPVDPPAAPSRGGTLLCEVPPSKDQSATPRLGMMRIGPGTTPPAPANGENWFVRNDLVVPGVGLDFDFTRTYRSRLGEDRPMGFGWTHSYDLRARKDSPTAVTVFDGAGRADVFTLGGGGVFACPERFERGALNGGGTVFTLTFPDGGKWDFDMFGALPPAANVARIVAIRDRNANAITFAYSAGGLLTTVTDTLARNYTLAYAGGRLATLTDFSGRVITYTHDAAGDLVGVRSPAVVGTPTANDFPTGKTSAYTYSSGTGDPKRDHNLLTVTDGLGQTPLVFTYDPEPNPANLGYDRLTRAQIGTAGQDIVITYERLTPSPANAFATLRAYVNDRRGFLTEIDYDSLNRDVRIREYTGQCIAGVPVTAVANRPGAQLRAGDPAFRDTLCKWNSDSLPTQKTFPRGNTHEWLWKVDARVAGSVSPEKKAQLLLHRQRAEVAGVYDQDEIVSRFVHDENFGAGRGVAFPTVMMDGRGFSTLTSYDARGNALSVDRAKVVASPALPPSGAGVFELYDFTYDVRGRLASRRCPDNGSAHRRLDTFAYDPLTAQLATETCDSGGLNLLSQYEYDARGNLIRHVNPRGFDTLITRNALNQAVRVETPSVGAAGRGRTHIFYDANDNVTRTDRANKDENGAVGANAEFTSSWTYDVLNAPLTTTQEIDAAATATTAFIYDANRNITEMRLPEAVAGTQPDNIVRVTYDDRDKPFTLISAPGTGLQSSTRYSYDENENPTTIEQGIEGPTPRVWTVDWDSFRRKLGSWPEDPNVSVDGDGSARISNGGPYGGQAGEVFNGPWVPWPSDLPPAPRFPWEDPIGGTPEGITATPNARTSGRSGGLVAINEGSAPISQLVFTPPPASPAVDGKRVVTIVEFIHLIAQIGILSSVAVPNFMPYQRRSSRTEARNLGVFVDGVRSGLGAGAAPPVTPPPAPPIFFPPSPGFGLNGRPIRIDDPMGNSTEVQYDEDGNPIGSVTKGEHNDIPGAAGNVPLRASNCSFDPLNRPLVVTVSHFDPVTAAPIGDGARTTTFAWTDFSSPKTGTNDRGFVTTCGYDRAGRHFTTTDPLGNVRLRVLDSAGNVMQEQSNEKSALGSPDQIFIVMHAYDERDRCTATTDGSGNTTAFRFDSNSRPVAMLDPAGTLTRYEWDARDLETGGFTDLDNSGGLTVPDIRWQNAYDRNGRHVASTDDNAHTTVRVFDALDRVVRVVGADGTQHNTTYDVHHNPVQQLDQNGTQLTHLFDLNNRLTQRNVVPGPGIAATTQQENFAHDGRGFIVGAQTQGAGLLGAISHTSTLARDSHGNVFSETQDALVTTRTHDGVGNCLTLMHPTGRDVTTTYDGRNRPSTVQDTSGPVAQLFYIGDRLERVVNGNGTRTDFVWDGVFGVANPPGDFGFRRIVRETHTHVPSATLIEDRVFSWDRRQNKTARIDVRPGGPQQMHQYTYDRANRLIATLVNGLAGFVRQTNYVLDGVNNRQNVNGPGTPNPGAYLMNAGAPTFDFEMNQYTNTPFGPQQYNAAGQTTQLAGAQFFRDYAGRLVGYVPPASPPLAVYDYDALGRRVRRVLNPTGAAQPTSFGFAGSVLVSEIPAAGASRDFVGIRIEDDPEMTPREELVCLATRGAVNAWPHHDDLGNALAFTDAAGVVLGRVEYQDYGVPEFFNPAGAPVPASPGGNPLLFCGMYYDTESGLYDVPVESFGFGAGGSAEKPDPAKPRVEDYNFVKARESASLLIFQKGSLGGGGSGIWGWIRRAAQKYDPKTGRTDTADILTSGYTDGANGNRRDATGSNPWSGDTTNFGRIDPAYGPLR